MDNNTYAIDDFVEIKVFINNSDTPIENSGSATIDDIFKSHLAETYTNAENLKPYGIDVFKIRIGDTLTINPSKWTTTFCEDKGLELGGYYEFRYEVNDIRIKYYSKNPTYDSAIPQIQIAIELRQIQADL